MQTIEQQLETKTRERYRTVSGIADCDYKKEDDDEYSCFSLRRVRNLSQLEKEDDNEDDVFEGLAKKKNAKKFEKEFYTNYQGETLLDCEPSNKENDDYYSEYQNCMGIGCEQYFADNDQMLGSDSRYHYKSNILLQKTEEEDLNELEELITKLNKMFKNEIDESKIEDYTEILCRYFKANIQYSVMKSNDEDISDSNFPIHQIIGNGYTQKKGSINMSSNKSKCSTDLRRSLSFNCLTEFNLKRFVGSVITLTQKKSKAEITNSHTYNDTESCGVLKDNIQEIINENLEAYELIKVNLIGDIASRSKFFQALKGHKITPIEDSHQNAEETLGT